MCSRHSVRFPSFAKLRYVPEAAESITDAFFKTAGLFRASDSELAIDNAALQLITFSGLTPISARTSAIANNSAVVPMLHEKLDAVFSSKVPLSVSNLTSPS